MKLLIADDELQIRTGLAEGIPWKTLGFEEVFTAENGVQGLNICKEHHPEIIITDIRMPGMTGLDLGKAVKEQDDFVEVIVLSGYSDFEYAREAIEMRAFQYLLKPIKISELISCVERAKEKIQKVNRENDSRKELYVINRKRIMQQIFSKRELLKEEDVQVLQEQLELSGTNPVIVGICSADRSGESVQGSVPYFIKCRNNILDPNKMKELYVEDDSMYWIMEVLSENDKQRKVLKLKEQLLIFNKLHEKQFFNTMSMSVSHAGNLQEATLLLNEAKQLLKKRMYEGAGCFAEWEKGDEEQKIRLNPINTAELQKRIESLDIERVNAYLEEVFETLEHNKVTSVNFVKSICEQLKNILLQTLLDKGIDIEGIFEHNRTLLNDIPEYRTMKEYKGWIDTLYQSILQGLSQLSGKRHSRVILQAVDFISKNYAGDINLEMTADYVQKSKNYFSYLFKKELGNSFVEYLNQVRVENAKKLLDTTDERTYEISEYVGYKEYKYFSSVFKKITGFSPAQYRKRQKS